MLFERTLLDAKAWCPLIGKIYYQENPRNRSEYRTIRLTYSMIADKIIPQTSNYVTGVPPEGLEPVNPRVLSALATMQGPGFIDFRE